MYIPSLSISGDFRTVDVGFDGEKVNLNGLLSFFSAVAADESSSNWNPDFPLLLAPNTVGSLLNWKPADLGSSCLPWDSDVATGFGVTVLVLLESGFCSGDLDPKVNDFCPKEKLEPVPNAVDLELSPLFSVLSLSVASVSDFPSIADGVPNENPELFIPAKLKPPASVELVTFEVGVSFLSSVADGPPNEKPVLIPPKLNPLDSEEPVALEADVPNGKPTLEETA